MQCKYNAKENKQTKKSAADNKKRILFVPRCEIWRDVVFKLTDCPRNVGDSATPSDKEDLISTFFQKKYKKTKTMLHQFYFPFSAR